MRPLADWPDADRRQIIGVFTDIDDTLTTDGAITLDALQALGELKAAGLHVIPITGRPVGWSEPFARGDFARGIAPWPVDAIVAENGSVALLCKENGKSPTYPLNSLLSKIYQQDANTRATNFARMQQVAQRVLRDVAGTMLSHDSPGRETDIAIDHSEFTHLSASKIEKNLTLTPKPLRNSADNASNLNDSGPFH